MGGMDVDNLCAPISGDGSLTFSPIGRVLADNSSEVTPAVGYTRLPLPSVDNTLVPDLVWVPVWVPVSVPRGAFAGAWVRLQGHYISRVGLCSACGGLRFSPAPPAIRRMDSGPTVRRAR